MIHVLAEHLVDLSGLLGRVGERDEAFPLPHGWADEAKHGGRSDPQSAGVVLRFWGEWLLNLKLL